MYKILDILGFYCNKCFSFSRYINRSLNVRQITEKTLTNGALQKFNDLKMFLSILGGRKLKKIVEIGTAEGGTLCMWLQIADRHATIVALDSKITDKAKKIKVFKKKHQNLFFLENDSHKLGTLKIIQKIMGYQKIDLLFIDGDHSYTGVKKDWDLYSPLVKKGGLVVFHDINHHSKAKSCQVDKFWNEIKQSNDHIEISMDINADYGWGKWAGLGIIFM